MLVTVIKTAFYNDRRVRVGDIVEVPETFKASWFAKNDTHAAKAAKAPPVKDTPKALSELGGAKTKTFNEVLSELGGAKTKTFNEVLKPDLA